MKRILSICTVALLLAMPPGISFANETAVLREVQLANDAPNQYVSCLAKEQELRSSMGEANQRCQAEYRQATKFLGNRLEVFNERIRELYERRELRDPIAQLERTRNRPRPATRYSQREAQRLAYENDVANGRARDEKGIAAALNRYSACIRSAPDYATNFDLAKLKCDDLRHDAAVRFSSEVVEESMAVVDAVIMDQWRASTQGRGRNQ